jgi:hypothetical protein
MYKDVEHGDIGEFLEQKSIKLRPSRREQIDLPSVFHTEEDDILGERKVDATMADHLVSRGQTRSRKMKNHYLVQLGGVVLPQCEVYLAT